MKELSARSPSRTDAAFTQRTYVHASNPDLEQGRRALARIHKIA